MTPMVALTGATGFVGGAVLNLLLEKGYQVRALSRQQGKPSARAGLEVFAGDLGPECDLSTFVAGADAVVHLAGLVKAPSRQAFFRVNCEGTGRLAVAAAKLDPPPRFILLSSLAAREPGLSAYAASKQGAEARVDAESRLSDCWILRPPAVYGPGDRATRDIFHQLVRGRCLVPGSGLGRFSMLYVDDLAAAVESLLARPSGRGLYELHDGRPGGYDWAALAAVASSVVRKPVRLWHLPRPLLLAVATVMEAAGYLTQKTPPLSRDKLRELCHPDWVARRNLLDEDGNWRPKVGAEEGFARAIEWYKAQNWI